MSNLHQNVHLKAKVNPYISFFSLFFFVIAGFAIGPFIAYGIIKVMYGAGMVTELSYLQSDMDRIINNEQTKVPILIMQGVTSLFAFIIFPLIFLYFIERKKLLVLFNNPIKDIKPIVLTVILVFFFMMVNSIIIKWNAEIKLPSFFAEFERFAQQTENSAKVLTQFFTNFHSFSYFLMAFIVIAIVAAVGEELVFRGLIQNYLIQATRNVHWGIWLAALLFSLFHMQFYGLIPRMLLGVLFGYIYLWSGNLIYPIIAHLVNNGFMITVLYLHQKKAIDYDIETNTSIPLLPWLASLGIAIWLLVVYKRYFDKKTIING